MPYYIIIVLECGSRIHVLIVKSSEIIASLFFLWNGGVV